MNMPTPIKCLIIILAVVVAAFTAGAFGVLALMVGVMIGYVFLAGPAIDRMTEIAFQTRKSSDAWKRLYYAELSKGALKYEINP
jgi:ABC-type nickel/cobalt efflux system permease component RcnA